MNNRINHLAVWILVVIHQIIGFGSFTSDLKDELNVVVAELIGA